MNQYFTILRTVEAVQITVEFLQSDLQIKGVTKHRVYVYANKIGQVGDWIVRENGLNRIMTDKEFKRQYQSAEQHLKEQT